MVTVSVTRSLHSYADTVSLSHALSPDIQCHMLFTQVRGHGQSVTRSLHRHLSVSHALYTRKRTRSVCHTLFAHGDCQCVTRPSHGRYQSFTRSLHTETVSMSHAHRTDAVGMSHALRSRTHFDENDDFGVWRVFVVAAAL